MIDLRDMKGKSLKLPVALFYDYKEKSTKFELLDDVLVTFGGQEYTIAKSFVSDGASIPSCFWSVADPFNAKYIGAFLKHDARLCDEANV